MSRAVTACLEPCICCSVAYDNFDSIAAHKGISMIAPPPYSRIAPETSSGVTYFPIGNKKTKYFYNNTMTNYNVVIVKTMCEDISEYSPAIRLQVSSMRQPMRVMTLKTGQYMRIKTVKIIFYAILACLCFSLLSFRLLFRLTVARLCLFVTWL